jgi:transposase InsO family protein
VLSEAKRKNVKLILNHVHSDEGKEYLNSDFAALMEKNGIRHTYSYEGEYAKNSLVERFNLTLCKLMEKMQGERRDC